MLTYQIKPRFIKIESASTPMEFPNKCEITIELSPSEAFGKGDAPSKAIIGDGTVHFLLNANSGRVLFRLDPAATPIKFALKNSLREGHDFMQDGNFMRISGQYSSLKELENDLFYYHYVIPIIYNTFFQQEIYVSNTFGKIDKFDFRWEILNVGGELQGIRVSEFEKILNKVHLTIPKLFENGRNGRLLAAMFYFSTAKRLSSAGNTPFEFMSEIILNYNKILEVLFGQRRDKIRDGLSSLGYSPDDIEDKYIPINILRNQIDVGHASLTRFPSDFLFDLYKFLEVSERNFQALLINLSGKITDSIYTLNDTGNPQPDEDKLSIIKDLHRTIKKSEQYKK